MSLIDALLLDPARIDVYVAISQVDSSGSGTETDPWNGGLRLATSEFSVSGLSIASQTATLTTASAHGYGDGDLVMITGATDPLLTGVFFVLNKTATTFQIVVVTPELTLAANDIIEAWGESGSTFDCVVSGIERT